MSYKLKSIIYNREYKIIQKNYKTYCIICNRRCGRYNCYCGPLSNKKNRSWKQYRKKQYKEVC